MFTVKSLVRDAYASDSKATHIRPAGVTTFSVESIKDAVTWSEPPPTPPDQQKYRQSTLHKPGQIVRHPGAADDPLPEGPFGDKSVYGESVAQNMQAYPRTEISRWTLDRAEDVYERWVHGRVNRMLCSWGHVLGLHASTGKMHAGSRLLAAAGIAAAGLTPH